MHGDAWNQASREIGQRGQASAWPTHRSSLIGCAPPCVCGISAGERRRRTSGGSGATSCSTASDTRRRWGRRRSRAFSRCSRPNQALAALLFLYRVVLDRDVPWLDGLVRAKRPARLPIVKSRAEVRCVLAEMHGVPQLMAVLLYGAGLRLLECARLRVKDVDFARRQLVVRAGKGERDRTALLPAVSAEPLRRHLDRVVRLHGRDVEQGAGWVELPLASCHGSGCSPRLAPTASPRPVSADGITCTSRFCNDRSVTLRGGRGSPSA